ncbi:MMPL family transporter [Alicyclobacillus sp. SO9]|uniref:MMPL family transporter n=1 Tax=Alicyclobacillus sp. SO9 TaxID=2665646 RepID=UPI0018E7BFA5|nr:MMPL family transporter [Alicyclobacillus sp. SO9]QQE78888.1 MMPL family transporter [Alicyclobacillus sp. SO9]
MYKALGRIVYRLRWGIIVVWLAFIVLAVTFLPSLSGVVAHTKTNFVPSSSNFVQAQNMLKHVDSKHQSTSSAVVAIHRNGKLTSKDKSYFKAQLQKLSSSKGRYGLSAVTDLYNTDKSVSSNFVSKNGTTEIALIGFPNASVSQATKTSLHQVKEVFSSPPTGSKVQMTGDVPIEQDNIRISMDGVKKTSLVTITLVLLILLVVFRSVVAPFVTLISIGLSFILTSYVVAWLSKFGLPVSTFTQTFLVAVIFGAGTDYSIIIMNRFREELAKQNGEVVPALAASYGAIGKTVLFSGLTVFVSFAVLYFAHFGLYRTAVGVAVGVVITLLLCFTFIPAMLGILGRFLFWPRKSVTGNTHSQSRIWGFTGRTATRHPWLTILALIIVLLPTALLFTNKRTFDPMSDIPGAPSVNAFHTISKAFSPGQVMPTSIVLHTSQNLRSPQGLTTIESISKALKKQSGVSQVDSATRPTGSVIKGFQIANQNASAASGLKKANKGLSSVSSGLQTTVQKLQSGQSGVKKLSSGASQVSSGLGQLQTGINQMATSSSKLATGAQTVNTGAKQFESGLNQYTASVSKVNQGADSLAKGLQEYAAGENTLASKLGQFAQQLSQGQAQLVNTIKGMIQQDQGSNPVAAAQLTALLKAIESPQGLSAATDAASKLSQGAQQANGGLGKLVQGANKLASGTSQLADNGSKLNSGASGIVNGTAQVAQGTSALSGGLQKVDSNVPQLTAGSQQIANGLQSFVGSYNKLPSGLTSMRKGVDSVHSGVGKVQSYLHDSKVAQSKGNPGFYVPSSSVNSNKDLQKAMNAYISKDGHTAKFTVILKSNPYSNTAIKEIPKLEQAAQAALNTSPIHSGRILAAGTSAQQNTLNRISTNDFVRTVILILGAIFILLMLMLRSIVTPLYIIASLASTYFVTMGVLQEVFVNILGKPGLSWVVPFFGFLLLVALGVDYSIFLMTRFEEEYRESGSFSQAILSAMKNMGNVVFSAALIMAGTFGSMLATGVTSLVEIGSSIIIGLAIYALVVLAFFIPACATVVNVGHLWPFQSREKDDSKSDKHSLSSSPIEG